jgi:hypothetical protein
VLKLGAVLCLILLLPACIHTAGEAAMDDPAITGPWWLPPASLGGSMPAAGSQGSAETRIAKNGPVAQVSQVQAGPAAQEPPAATLSEDDLLPVPPSREVLEARRQKEKAQAQPDLVKTEVRSAPLPATPAPAPEDPPLVMAVRCLLNKKPAEAVGWLERCDSEKSSQELLLTLLSLAARIAEGDLKNMTAHEASATVAQLDHVAEGLRPLAEFTIEKMCFCYHIAGFGVYHPWKEDHVFKPREQVQIYVEFRNFASGQRKNLYGIELASTLEIREPDGKLALSINPRDGRKPYLSLSPRQDFFVNYQFEVPDNLPLSRYTLWVRVTDKPTGRTASRSMDFRVQNSLARGE